MKYFIRAIMVFFVCVVGWPDAQTLAQDDEWVNYTALDNGFTFQHPASWQVIEEDYHFVSLLGEIDDAAGQSQRIIVQVVDPEMVEVAIGSTVDEVIDWLRDNMEGTVSETATSVTHGSLTAQRLKIDLGFAYSFQTTDYDACLVMVGVSSGEIDEQAEALVFELFASIAKPLYASFFLSGAEPLEVAHRFDEVGLEIDLPAGWSSDGETYAPTVMITNRDSFDNYDPGRFTAMLTVTRASWLYEEFKDYAPLRVVLSHEIDLEDFMIEGHITRHYSNDNGMEITMAWGSLLAENPGIILRQMEDGYILKLRFDFATQDQMATALAIVRSARIIGDIPSVDSGALGSADLPPTTDSRQISIATVDSLTEINHIEIEGDSYALLGGMDLSLDGQWLAVAYEGGVSIYDAQSMEVVRTYPLGSTDGNDVAFSPDGATVAIATGNLTNRSQNRVVLWTWETSEIEQIRSGRSTQPVLKVAYHPSGTRLSMTQSSWWPAIIDLQTGKILYDLTGEPMAFSPDGQWIAVSSASRDGNELRLYDIDGELVHQWPRPDDQNGNDIKFSPDGRLVAIGFTGVDDGKSNIRVWEVATGEVYLDMYFDLRIPSQGLSDDVETFAFSQDSTLLVAGMDNGSILLWDTATGRPIKRLEDYHPLGIVDILISPDGQRMYVADFGGEISVWHIDEDE